MTADFAVIFCNLVWVWWQIIILPWAERWAVLQKPGMALCCWWTSWTKVSQFLDPWSSWFPSASPPSRTPHLWWSWPQSRSTPVSWRAAESGSALEENCGKHHQRGNVCADVKPVIHGRLQQQVLNTKIWQLWRFSWAALQQPYQMNSGTPRHSTCYYKKLILLHSDIILRFQKRSHAHCKILSCGFSINCLTLCLDCAYNYFFVHVLSPFSLFSRFL